MQFEFHVLVSGCPAKYHRGLYLWFNENEVINFRENLRLQNSSFFFQIIYESFTLYKTFKSLLLSLKLF